MDIPKETIRGMLGMLSREQLEDAVHMIFAALTDNQRVNLRVRIDLAFCEGCGVDRNTITGGICHCRNDE